MDLQRTLCIRLHPNAETAALFAETVRQYTSSFNEVARVGWERGVANGVALHKATYYTERERTGLPAQLTVRGAGEGNRSLEERKSPHRQRDEEAGRQATPAHSAAVGVLPDPLRRALVQGQSHGGNRIAPDALRASRHRLHPDAVPPAV